MAMDQKAAFADRLNRIKAGQQFEHADLVGHQTQVAYKKIHGDKARKPKRTPVEKLDTGWWRNTRRQATYSAAAARSMWKKAVRWVYDVLPNDPEAPIKEGVKEKE